ncbi:MAG TPA: DUF4446 family protein [Anaerolineae bacterium]|nr:DUF4446 family protein [Anaerolineae bacterium]
MEGAAVILAIVALAMAGGAAALVLRWRQRDLDVSPGGSRMIALERRVAQLGQRLEVLESEADAQRAGSGDAAAPIRSSSAGAAAISRIGLVRFDAFSDTGGAQSFALALVDDDGDGIVLTSLHSRPSTRVYIKTIRRGVADAPLSGEEEQALREAGITP